jgi:hypothetical protein
LMIGRRRWRRMRDSRRLGRIKEVEEAKQG